MNTIFISYRRDDGIDTAQLLQINLQKMFGDDSVFLDTVTMKAGDEFPIRLQSAIQEAKVVVAMIGPNWKGEEKDINRFENENDWVRRELEIALADENKKIYPVFVKGASVDGAFKDLPPTIERLKNFNIANLREKEFKQDLLSLIPLIEPYIELNNPLKDLPLDNERYSYPQGSPFKGLDFFRQEDARIFFGRGHEIRKLYNKLRNNKILMLYGQSGCGKSSLLFAGLKPRMENKEWDINYIRREPNINFIEKFNSTILSYTTSPNQLIIIDQVEEIFTNPNVTLQSSESELLQLLASIRNAKEKNINVILSFRKEFLADIRKYFGDLPFEDFYLEPLQTKGVLEAIRGITLLHEASDNYELKFVDDEVPIAIAQVVLGDEESQVAPLLQILLRKMWDQVAKNRPRIFSKKLLKEVKSNNLNELVNDQIMAIKDFIPEIQSGLVLDILYFFTTTRGTSASRSRDELIDYYDHPDILKIITELKNKYLLSDISLENINSTRLAHDALAPFIRELYGQSTLPGQRAARLLDSKKLDLESGSVVEFNKPDLYIIESGKIGMRKFTESELLVINKSKKSHLKEKIKKRSIYTTTAFSVLLIIAILIYISFKEKENKNIIGQSYVVSGISALAQKNYDSATVAITKALSFTDGLDIRENLIEAVSNKSKIVSEYNTGGKILANSINGKVVIVEDSKKQILKKWNLITRESFDILSTEDTVTRCEVSNDGELVVIGFANGNLKIFDIEKNILINSPYSHEEKISSISISGDNNLIAYGNEKDELWIFNIEKNIETMILLGETPSWGLSFSHDGKKLASGSGDNKLRLFLLINGNWVLQYSTLVHDDVIGNVTFSPDDEIVLTSSADATIGVISTKDGIISKKIYGHLSNINNIAFSKSGRKIISCGEDESIRIWDLESSRQTLMITKKDADFQKVFFLEDDNTFQYVLNDSMLFRRSMGSNQYINTLQNDSAFSHYCISLDSKFHRLASAGNDHSKILSARNRIWIWDLNKSKIITSIPAHSEDITSLAFNPEGTILASASNDKTIKFWNTENWEMVDSIFYGDKLCCVTYNRDSQLLAGGRQGNKAKNDTSYSNILIFDKNCKLIDSIVHLGGSVFNISTSSNQTFATGGGDNSVRLWNLENKKELYRFPDHDKSVWSVAFSYNDSLLSSGSIDNTIRIYNLKSKEVSTTLKDHNGDVFNVAFSPDGTWLASAGVDNTIRLWNLTNKNSIVLHIYNCPVWMLQFSGDSKKLYACGLSPELKIINIDETVDIMNLPSAQIMENISTNEE